MRTRTPRTTTVAALTCAALLTAATACGPAAGGAAPSAPASTARDPLAGREPAAVLRAAYEETERAASKTAVISRRTGTREITAKLSFEGDSCWGEVKVGRAGTGEILVDDSKVSLRGDDGFLRDQFGSGPAKSPDTADGWIDVKPGDPAVAHLVALCRDGSPARAFPADRTALRRGPDARLNGRPVAVLVSKGPGGTDITDHVALEGTPYLLGHAETGPEGGSVEYRDLTGPAA
ncbi:hypothetical protein BX286_3072 [Streptomyces sp. 3211.6]|uniref:hypothetical protein n=1 Tax=Streptomyces sp. 3211.6 TaxID=1938845 RepID=UPI000EB2C8E9|nr:hypothetical protein [Streptomyces sp. 3211.6]RKT05088.1 hypothetical protein BX286_3072 [Streptomyces sp. 3211.6]